MTDRLREALATLNPRVSHMAGVSGGADSMALLDALAAAGFRKLIVCHFSHGLRPEAAAVEGALVRRAAARLGARFLHGCGDTRGEAARKGGGIEAAARRLRHAFFADCARRARCRRLVLAHHMDDQAETVLLNLCRGSGTAGLGGMAPEVAFAGFTVLRPLLGIRRAELLAYVRQRRIRFCEDPSNASPDQARNRIRHRVFPALEAAMGTSVVPCIARAAEILRAENAWMESATPAPADHLRTSELAALPPALQRRMVHRWLKEHGVAEPGFEETRKVLELLAGSVAKVNLPQGRHARRRAGILFIEGWPQRPSPKEKPRMDPDERE